MKIGVGLCFYEDLDSLKRCLPLISPNVDYIFAIDGRFSLLEGNDFSSQETQDYVKSFPNVIYEQFVGMEHDKRDKYVRLCEKYNCDVLFIHDSDEFALPETDWTLFKKSIEDNIKKHPNLHYFSIDMLYTPPDFKGTPEYTPYPRVWVNLKNLGYYKCHNLFSNGVSVTKSGGSPLVRLEGMKMAMGDDLRSHEYLDKVCKYRDKLLEYEQPIREAYRKY